MIVLLIFAAAMYWLFRQHNETNRAKWTRRVEAMVPIGRYLMADLQAIRNWRKPPEPQPARVYTDEEIRKMLDL